MDPDLQNLDREKADLPELVDGPRIPAWTRQNTLGVWTRSARRSRNPRRDRRRHEHLAPALSSVTVSPESEA